MIESLDSVRRDSPQIIYESMAFEGKKIPVAIADGGKKAGPSLIVVGMQHAVEFSGPGGMDRVLDVIDPARLNGRLVCLPFVNPIQRDMTAEEHKQQWQNVETNLNRQWPGDAKSNNVLSRLAAFLWERVITRADAVLDMHCCRTLDPRFASALDGHEAGTALAVATGLEAVDLQTEDSYAKGILHATASRQLDIPAVLIESHPAGFQVREAVEACALAILRSLRHLGILETIPCWKSPDMNPVALFRRSEKGESAAAKRNGYLCTRRWPGERVKEGEVVAMIRSLDTFEIIENVVSPLAGAVGCAAEPWVKEGDLAAHVKAVEWRQVT